MKSPNHSAHADILDRLSDEVALELIPAMVYVGTLMIMGLIGNLVVCYMFLFRIHTSTQNVLIVALAFFDVMCCAIAMPCEIVDMRYFYNFTNLVACRVKRFTNAFSAIGSICTLVVIAIYRYLKIIHSSKARVSKTKIFVTFVVIITVTTIFTIPIVNLDGIQTIETRQEGVQGHQCATNKALEDTHFPLIYNIILLMAFTIALILLSVIYGRIWHLKKTNDVRMFRVCQSLKPEMGTASPFLALLTSAGFTTSATVGKQQQSRGDMKLAQVEPIDWRELDATSELTPGATFGTAPNSQGDDMADSENARGDTSEGIDVKPAENEPCEEGENDNNKTAFPTIDCVELVQRGSAEDVSEPVSLERPLNSVFADGPQNSRMRIAPPTAEIKKSDSVDTGIRSTTNEEENVGASLVSTTQQDFQHLAFSTAKVVMGNTELQKNNNAKASSKITLSGRQRGDRLSLEPVILGSGRPAVNTGAGTREEPESRIIQRQEAGRASTRSQQSRLMQHSSTITAFSVTGVFFLSFMPHISLGLARLAWGDFDVRLEGAKLVLYNIILRSYFINASCNPIIYGVRNTQFRAEINRLLRSV